MSYKIEVCIDNLESLNHAIKGGAHRIELCSSLALGGLTPSFGVMKKVAQLSLLPVYAMIRPRQGDFLYNSYEIESMIEDIHIAKMIGLQGVVFGVLDQNANIDMDANKALMSAANGMGVTFHRAIDQCSDYQQAIENIINLGCERILTSGLAPNALEGINILEKMVKQADKRITIMAGSGVTALNASEIIVQTGIQELHLSAGSVRGSKMRHISALAKMGENNIDDFKIPVTSIEKIQQLKQAIRSSG